MRVCSACGSDRVYCDAYVGLNDPEDVLLFSQEYCAECGGETTTVEVEEMETEAMQE